jgi:plastocyanin
MATKNVSIQDNRFEPPNCPVNTGDTVTWTNTGNHTHTVTADNGDFDSGDLSPRQQFYQTFKAAGVVAYHCEKHAGMKGTVTAK